MWRYGGTSCWLELCSFSIALSPRDCVWRPWNVLQYLARHAWQLGNVHRDKERLVSRQPLHRHLPLRLILEIEIGDLLAVGVLHDEGFLSLLESTRAAGSGAVSSWGGTPRLPSTAPCAVHDNINGIAA
jgi:hypothetical protein